VIIKNLKIEKVVFKGLGLGFDSDGAIFVDNSYPGDLLDVKVFHKKGKVRFAKIQKIIKPSHIRKKAPCEVFGLCGGCDWLDIDYSNQLKLKQDIMQEIMGEMGAIQPIIGSEEPIYYRNKSFLPVSTKNGKPIIGIFQKRSHVVIAHKDCKIQPSIYDEIVTEFLAYIEAAKVKIYDEKTGNGNLRHLGFRKSAANGQIIVVIVTKNRKLPFTKQLINNLTGKFPQIIGIIQNINSEKGNAILGKDEKILFGKDYLIETIGKISYHLNYRSFFQINHSTTEKLYDFVKSQISKNEIILDAYSGVGTIGIYLADKAKEVIGVEFVAAAVKDAKQNIEFNNIDNCRYYVGLVEDKIEEICKKTVLDTIIFDPPRKGLEKKIIEVLKHNEIKKVIYVSCNPMTQKRDVHMLNEIGYKIKKIQPFDMFPQTWHIENVVVLEK